ncbi:MAG: hypothetical protein GF341_08995, partial [candidate division Zixibacteria bacterium]|nr:hypothetical protein [candidate division Zixibacteria bacterium]
MHTLRGGHMRSKRAFVSLCCLLLALLLAGEVSAEVDTAWVRYYDGPANDNDRSQAVDIDTDGNIYITGYSIGVGADWDIVTIKYTPDGDTSWVRRYDGPAHDTDDGTDVAVHTDGSVYVTASSKGVSSDQDFVVLKYGEDGATGWVWRYNGPANISDGAHYVQLDADGNVYTTGVVYVAGTNLDYFTAKLDSAGDTIWTRTYKTESIERNDYPKGLEIDGLGNVYVTGGSPGANTNYDYATIKYNSDGNPQWARRYYGPGNGNDHAYDLELDDAGNVYVTGYSGFDPESINNDLATLKYGPNGDTLWIHRYDGDGDSMDVGYDLELDAFGNVYVGGRTWNGTDFDYIVLKINTEGDTSWVRQYDGSGHGYDHIYALELDPAGNIYVTGYSTGDGTDTDFVTLGYDPAGNLIHELRFNGPGNGPDGGRDMHCDTDGNIYVTGPAWTGTKRDYCLIKYRSPSTSTFTEVSATYGVDDGSETNGAAWLDFDNDNDLDLYVANQTANRLYRNDGSGFTDVAATLGVDGNAQTIGLAVGDYDNDGDEDIYLGNRNAPDLLLRNDLPNVVGFTDVTDSLELPDNEPSGPAAWIDYDLDGDLDLYTENDSPNSRLFRNDDTVFVDVAASAGLTTSDGEGISWADFDNDGDMDLYCANYNAPKQLWCNDGGIFTDVAAVWGCDAGGGGRGCPWG